MFTIEKEIVRAVHVEQNAEHVQQVQGEEAISRPQIVYNFVSAP